MAANPRAERFFLYIAVLMVALVVTGFAAAAFRLPEFVYPPPPFLILHGLIALGWYVLTATQAALIGRGRYDLHRTMGAASLVLAIAMVVTGYLVIRGAVLKPNFEIAGLSPLGSTIFPTLDLLGFSLFYALGIANRTNGAAHKRLMVLAGIVMLPPATARLGLAFGFEPLAGVIALLLTLAFMIYDWRTRGRPHWASVLGLVVAVGGMPLRFFAGQSEGWAELAGVLYS